LISDICCVVNVVSFFWVIPWHLNCMFRNVDTPNGKNTNACVVYFNHYITTKSDSLCKVVRSATYKQWYSGFRKKAGIYTNRVRWWINNIY